MSDASDFDRGRRRKKKILKKPEKEPDLMAGKAPTILTKPPSERLQAAVRASSAETVPVPAMPTRILRSREEDRSLSSPSLMATPALSLSSSSTSILSTLQSSVAGLNITDDTQLAQNQQTSTASTFLSAPKIQIQQKILLAPASTGNASSVVVSTPTESRNSISESNSLASRLSPYVEMKGSVKLIDEAMQFCDHISEFLQDQSDFLVVGVLGLQSAGKSTVMSLLSGRHDFRSSSRPGVFKLQTKDQRELGEHCTRGVDVFISMHRTILLDVQPMLSHSVLDHMIQFEKFPSEYGSTENALEIHSLQLAGFLMTVCHVVILVQDWFTDSNALRFVQAAEMLRPSALLQGHDGGDVVVDYFPHFVFVQNKCSSSDFEPMRVKSIQEMYSRVFEKSKLRVRAGNTVNELQATTSEDLINLFLLPWSVHAGVRKGSVDDQDLPAERLLFKGSPSLEQLAKTFRHQIHSMPRNQLINTTLNEKNWFHYAARTWETIKKSGLYMEYCRLLT